VRMIQIEQEGSRWEAHGLFGVRLPPLVLGSPFELAGSPAPGRESWADWLPRVTCCRETPWGARSVSLPELFPLLEWKTCIY
jgi:hypothetical protein